MLGDNLERSKNPLKKAMRRRNAKTVQFSDPTYFDAPEMDYSSGEDDQEPELESHFDSGETELDDGLGTADDHDDDISAVEPARAGLQWAETDSDVIEPVTTSRAGEVHERFLGPDEVSVGEELTDLNGQSDSVRDLSLASLRKVEPFH